MGRSEGIHSLDVMAKDQMQLPWSKLPLLKAGSPETEDWFLALLTSQRAIHPKTLPDYSAEEILGKLVETLPSAWKLRRRAWIKLGLMALSWGLFFLFLIQIERRIPDGFFRIAFHIAAFFFMHGLAMWRLMNVTWLSYNPVWLTVENIAGTIRSVDAVPDLLALFEKAPRKSKAAECLRDARVYGTPDDRAIAAELLRRG
jgi:hypothetical protein